MFAYSLRVFYFCHIKKWLYQSNFQILARRENSATNQSIAQGNG